MLAVQLRLAEPSSCHRDDPNTQEYAQGLLRTGNVITFSFLDIFLLFNRIKSRRLAIETIQVRKSMLKGIIVDLLHAGNVITF